MERLTNHNEAAGTDEQKDLRFIRDAATLNSVSKQYLHRCFCDLYDRLSAYEATGLEPDEINTMQSTLGECHKSADGLLKAQVDGRLAVLPCKLGDTVYKISPFNSGVVEMKVLRIVVDRFGFVVEAISVGGHESRFYDAGFGKRWFLTPEEAKSMLRGEER